MAEFNKYEELEKLAELLAKGILTQTEFEQRKAKILGGGVDMPTEKISAQKLDNEDRTVFLPPQSPAIEDVKTEFYFENSDGNTNLLPQTDNLVQRQLYESHYSPTETGNKVQVIIIIALASVLVLVIAGLGYYFFKEKGNAAETLNDTKTPESLQSLSTGTYMANASESNRIYFYASPNENTQKSAYILTHEKVYVEQIENGFGYVTFTNTQGQITKGWLKMAALTRIEGTTGGNYSEDMVYIKRKYAEIKAAKVSSQTFDVSDCENYTVTYHFRGNDIVEIDAGNCIGDGCGTTEYYFDAGKLFFIFNQTSYVVGQYDEGTLEDRLYLKADKCILYKHKEKRVTPNKPDKNIDEVRECNADNNEAVITGYKLFSAYNKKNISHILCE